MKNNWPVKKLGEVAVINPPKSEVSNVPGDTSVSFVSMASINEQSGTIANLEKRSIEKVRKGYTYFSEDDVLFAKITPCMENGKAALAQNLANQIGFGTTEVHVIRASDEVSPEWIYALVRRQEFRDKAQSHMTGTAGQQRVPKNYLENVLIPVPPKNIQKNIVKRLGAIREAQELNDEMISKTNELYESLIDNELKSSGHKKVKLINVVKPQVTINPKSNPETDYAYIDISSIDSNNYSVDPNGIKHFKGMNAPSRARKKIKYGDILFSTVRPNLKRIARVDFPTHNSLASTGFTVLSPDENKINADYMGIVTCSGIVTEQVIPSIREQRILLFLTKMF